MLQFIRRNESLECRYRNKRDDELRLWFRHVEASDIDLSKTALVGFVDREAVLADTEGLDEYGGEIVLDIDDCNQVVYEEFECTHEGIKEAILQLHRCGYEYFKLSRVRSLIGYTLAELRQSRPDFAAFLDDYQQCESYRYMTSRTDHLPLTTYTDMFSYNFLPYRVEDELCRLALQDDLDNIGYYKTDYLNQLIMRRSPNNIEAPHWNLADWRYYCDPSSGVWYRLYRATRRSKYDFLPYELFKRALQCQIVDKQGEDKLKEIYAYYSSYMVKDD